MYQTIEYEPVTSLVNGEIIKDLLNLCNNNFINPMFQPYAGANYSCLLCGAIEKRNGSVDHSSDCPVLKYKKIVMKHKRWIVKK